MRAREFVMNVPITIKINGDGDPEVDMTNNKTAKDPNELDPDPTMVPPLQQSIELQKEKSGKNSSVIADLTQDEIETDDEPIRFVGAKRNGRT